MTSSSAALAQPVGARVRRATLLWWAPFALLVLCLGACGPRAPAAAVAVPVAANPVESPPATEPLRVVSAEATVISADGPKGMLSLRQSAQAELGWPAMTIAYRALGSAMSGLSPGDRIAFELELGGGQGGFIIASRKI